MFKPLISQDENFILKPLGANEEDFFVVASGLKELFSDPSVVKFHPEKKIVDSTGAEDKTFGSILGYELNTSYNHFLFEKKNNKLIGCIEILSPKGVFSAYKFFEEISELYPVFKETWIIEYYLKPEYWGKNIMPKFLDEVVKRILSNPKSIISAITVIDNIKSQSVLQKLNFKLFSKFDNKSEHWIKIQEGMDITIHKVSKH